jgi:hypothetical protein
MGHKISAEVIRPEKQHKIYKEKVMAVLYVSRDCLSQVPMLSGP